jgi:3-deoxy-manno-octulosonate cytidylyltransferase (CMP-KDO synthetase)
MSHAAPQLPGSPTPSAVAIIPARLGSTRLARKMLLRETGRYLFEHTARNLLDGGAVERVLVATDSEEILAAAAEVGLEGLMTSTDHESGTDRVREAYELLLESGSGVFDVVVNVQGDEPDLLADDLRGLIAAFADPEVELATLWAPLDDPVEARRKSTVKVVLDARGDALYFTRATVPDTDHARPGAETAACKRHIGVYAFRPAALTRFCSLPESELERAENLEQLRWLEAGGRLRVLPARHRPLGIDTLEDYRAFVARQASLPSNTQAT